MSLKEICIVGNIKSSLADLCFLNCYLPGLQTDQILWFNTLCQWIGISMIVPDNATCIFTRSSATAAPVFLTVKVSLNTPTQVKHIYKYNFSSFPSLAEHWLLHWKPQASVSLEFQDYLFYSFILLWHFFTQCFTETCMVPAPRTDRRANYRWKLVQLLVCFGLFGETRGGKTNTRREYTNPDSVFCENVSDKVKLHLTTTLPRLFTL